MTNLGKLLADAGIAGVNPEGSTAPEDPVPRLGPRKLAEDILPMALGSRLSSNKVQLIWNVRDMLREISEWNCREIKSPDFNGQVVFGILNLGISLRQEIPPSKAGSFFLGAIQMLNKANEYCEQNPNLSGQDLAKALLRELFG